MGVLKGILAKKKEKKKKTRAFRAVLSPYKWEYYFRDEC